MPEPKGWYVPCGCGHGDHLACDVRCHFGDCKHPIGRFGVTKKEKWANRYSGVEMKDIPQGRVLFVSPNEDLAHRILAALEAYQEAGEHAWHEEDMPSDEGRFEVVVKILDEEKP